MKPTLYCLRVISLLVIVSGLGTIFTQPAAGKDPKNSAQALVAEERRMQAFYDLEYAMRELMWHQSMSILAAYGEYNSYAVVGKDANADDLTRFKNRIGYNEVSIADFKRSLRLDRDLPPDDAERAKATLDLYDCFLSAAEKVAALLDNGDPGAANIAYRDGSVPVSKEITDSLYTLRRTAKDRFKKIARSSR